MRGLKGKNVLVTGGTSGIGQAIAVRFAECGANVAINYLRTPDEAAGTQEKVHACVNQVRRAGVRDVLVGGDVSREEDVVRMVEEAAEGLGGLDILINNAGIQLSRPSEELTSPEFDRVLAVNLRGAFLCAREAIKRFLADGIRGVVINVSSVHQAIPKPNYLGYSVSKGGMGNLTSTLALEYAGQGIRVVATAPGGIEAPERRIPRGPATEKTEQEKEWYQAIVDQTIGSSLMHRYGTLDEQAAPILFLASDEASYITGTRLPVAGGDLG
jgi:glucose 1-dehydrogenase